MIDAKAVADSFLVRTVANYVTDTLSSGTNDGDIYSFTGTTDTHSINIDVELSGSIYSVGGCTLGIA